MGLKVDFWTPQVWWGVSCLPWPINYSLSNRENFMEKVPLPWVADLNAVE